MVRKLGLIAYANDGGLGAQTRRLAQMLRPDRVLVIDSSAFSRNKTQHFEWYSEFDYFVTQGFPNNDQVKKFLGGLTHVFFAESPYNYGLIYWAEQQGIKTYCQVNYEFCQNLIEPWLPVPTKWVMPSYWKIDEMKELFGEDKVVYLPPPIHQDEFARARDVNMKRRGKVRFLHVIGTAAIADRNGTLDLLEAIKLTKSDFELVIRTQHPISMDAFLDDPRVTYELGSLKDNQDLYENFDALLLPRRWGGLCLPINEALLSGLPVLTSDMEPQNKWLPHRWLVKSEVKGSFMAKSGIQFNSVNHQAYADKIDWFCQLPSKHKEKTLACTVGIMEFSFGWLSGKYLDLFDNGES